MKENSFSTTAAAAINGGMHLDGGCTDYLLCNGRLFYIDQGIVAATPLQGPLPVKAQILTDIIRRVPPLRDVIVQGVGFGFSDPKWDYGGGESIFFSLLAD